MKAVKQRGEDNVETVLASDLRSRPSSTYVIEHARFGIQTHPHRPDSWGTKDTGFFGS
ncbi:hypothetical protein VIBNISOn1_p0010 [Vibrio nigripulchritudo SOn1]|uniref:Uncharacterized protein n=1 Tax=Vibrio nigripulchritudo SOn1 TaxID=1238450 RepID=A0AAV2VZZ1_9VIBR|nr:hypothetical protein VIBNISOn1_p0010 [Vibrio nigripulchritudo SOn1]